MQIPQQSALYIVGILSPLLIFFTYRMFRGLARAPRREWTGRIFAWLLVVVPYFGLFSFLFSGNLALLALGAVPLGLGIGASALADLAEKGLSLREGVTALIRALRAPPDERPGGASLLAVAVQTVIILPIIGAVYFSFNELAAIGIALVYVLYVRAIWWKPARRQNDEHQ